MIDHLSLYIVTVILKLNQVFIVTTHMGVKSKRSYKIVVERFCKKLSEHQE